MSYHNLVIARRHAGESLLSISKDLAKTNPHNCPSYFQIRKIWKNHQMRKNVDSSLVRSIKFAPFEMREITSTIESLYQSDSSYTSKQLMQIIKDDLGFDIKKTMIKRIRKQLGYSCKSTKAGHMIRDQNKVKRLAFCEEMMEKRESFDDIIFSDETTVQLDSNSRICFVKPGDQLRRRRSVAKHPYKVHCWAGISTKGATDICIWDGKSRMDSALYCRIIEEYYIPFATNVFKGRCRLAQDNDPKHTSNYTRTKFTEWNIDLIKWPPESPDLNPIEKVWNQLKNYLRSEFKPTNKDQLYQGISKFWSEKMTPIQCSKYIAHMPKAMQLVKDARGDHSGE